MNREMNTGLPDARAAALAAIRDFDALHSRKPAASPAPFQPLTLRAQRVAAREAFAPSSARPRVLHKKGQFRYA